MGVIVIHRHPSSSFVKAVAAPRGVEGGVRMAGLAGLAAAAAVARWTRARARVCVSVAWHVHVCSCLCATQDPIGVAAVCRARRASVATIHATHATSSLLRANDGTTLRTHAREVRLDERRARAAPRGLLGRDEPCGGERERGRWRTFFHRLPPHCQRTRPHRAASPTGCHRRVNPARVLLSLAARARAERDEVVHEVGLGASGGGYIVVVVRSTYDTSVCDRHVSSQRRPRAWGPPT